MIIRLLKEQLNKEKAYFTSKPNLAILNLTYRCNLNCKTCRLPTNKNKNEKELSLDEIKKLINELDEMNIKDIRIVDSEALLRQDIPEIIKHIKNHGMEIHLVTNGTLINHKIAHCFVDSKVDRISISLDGPDEKTHDYIRGKSGAFKKTKEGIKLLVKLKKEMDSNLPKVHILSLVSSLNFNNIREISKLKESLNADEISFSYISETSMERFENTKIEGKKIASNRFVPKEKSLLLNSEEIKFFREEIKDLDLNSLKIIKCLKDDQLKKGTFPVKKCYHLMDSITFDPYGNIIPCANLINYSYGNIREKSIKEIWNNQRHNALKNRLKVDLFPVCSSCCHFLDNFTLGQYVRLFFGLNL